ncbi:MAG: lactate utilization protein [Flavobacteriaceae bacterium]|nr:lactate utilization protein [Flavobacteriaceae bacterium]
MPKDREEQFEHLVAEALANNPMQDAVAKSVGQWAKQHEHAREKFNDLELARRRAGFIRWRAIESLDKYLIEFESNFQKKGGKVIWAPTAADALKEIETILQKHGNGKVVKSKSSACEEVGLNEFLTAKKTEVLETDLGAYIQQRRGQKPFHPVTPAMHQTREQAAAAMPANWKLPQRAQATEIAEAFAKNIHQEFAEAGVGITGANFLISETGSITLVENEGNAALVSLLPKTLIVLAGIDKITCHLNDLDTLLPMLSAYGTGEILTAYNSILGGPAKPNQDGPNEIYVILLDNGRSNLLANTRHRQAAHCIRCGACHHVCPVFKQIGGHSYDSAYNGPIGQVTMPWLQGFKENKHLPYASTACGACTTVCPVKIDLHELIVSTRNEMNEAGMAGLQEKYMWGTWKKMMLKRKRMNQSNAIKGFMFKTAFRKGWGQQRVFPGLAERSFNEMWKDQFGEGGEEG